MRVFKKYDIGLISFPENSSVLNYLLPKSVIYDDNHPIFEKGYWWFWFFLYKRKTCTRCGVVSCRRGLIPLYYDIESKSKVIGWFCPSCGKTIKEIHHKSRKRCNGCRHLRTETKSLRCDGGEGCTKQDVK